MVAVDDCIFWCNERSGPEESMIQAGYRSISIALANDANCTQIVP